MATRQDLEAEDACNTEEVLRKKNERSKKSELLREIHKIEVQIQALERERMTHIFSKRSDFRHEFSTLEELEQKMNEDRKTEKFQLKQQLEKLSYMVKKLQRELKDIKPTPEFVAKLKLIMEEIEAAISVFKDQQRKQYEDLIQGERSLSQELQTLEKKFESWTKVSKNESASAVSFVKPSLGPGAQDVNKDLPVEVAAFDKFVQKSGGHRGGWDEYDHQTFMKYRNIHKGRITFLDQAKVYLPLHTEDEIREHETWYQEYLFLNENKKHAIKKWREKKEDAKEDFLSQPKDDSDEEVEEEKKRNQQMKLAKERSDRFKRLNAWNVHKELEKATKEERKLKESLEKQKHEEEERKRQIEIKRKVQEYQEQKKIEEKLLEEFEEERKQEEAEKKKAIAAKEIIRFRNRDSYLLQSKLEREREKEEKKKLKERKLQELKSQVQVSVERDPKRLLKPTAGWSERLKKKETSPSGGGQIYQMPHRAIPAWRQGP